MQAGVEKIKLSTLPTAFTTAYIFFKRVLFSYKIAIPKEEVTLTLTEQEQGNYWTGRHRKVVHEPLISYAKVVEILIAKAFFIIDELMAHEWEDAEHIDLQ